MAADNERVLWGAGRNGKGRGRGERDERELWSCRNVRLGKNREGKAGSVGFRQEFEVSFYLGGGARDYRGAFLGAWGGRMAARRSCFLIWSPRA